MSDPRDQLDLWPSRPKPAALRWSYSRGQRLAGCARAYYWYHYGSAGGTRPDAPPLARRAHALKALQGRFALAGELVHEAVAAALAAYERGERPDPQAWARRGQRRFWAAVHASRAGAAGVAGCRPTLVEHVYEDPGAAAWEAAADRVGRAIADFFALPLRAALVALPRHRLLARETGGSFLLAGATVMVRPDLAWREPDGKVALLDWKTGRAAPEHRCQLALYGLLAARLWADADASMAAHLVYLGGADGPRADVVALGPAERAAAEAAARASIARMQALAPARGAPPPSPEAFAPSPSPGRCGGCAFRQICAAAVDPAKAPMP